MQKTTLSYLLFFLCFGPFCSLAQEGVSTHPLSRHDSTKIIQWEINHEEQLEIGDRKEASRFLNEIALLYWNHSFYRKAIEYYERSIGLNKGVGNENGIAMINNNLGMLYSDIKDYEKSLVSFRKTLAARKLNNEPIGVISALINIAVVLNNLERHQEAVENLEEALLYARERNDADQMKSTYGMLAESYTKVGNAEKAQEYFELYRTFHEHVTEGKVRESVQREREAKLKAQLAEEAKKRKELELRLKQQELTETEDKLETSDSLRYEQFRELSKAEMQLEIVNQAKINSELEAKIAKEEKEIAELTRNMFIGGMVFFLVLAFVVARGYIEKRKDNKLLAAQKDRLAMQKERIEHQNHHITQSINYAKRIQEAALIDPEIAKGHLDDSFIFFRPRDIVSGDFYWFAEVENQLLVAAVDCTGHGVPGAFMSMLGINLLNQIVNEGESDPGKMLDKLKEGISETLHQDTTDNKDGMDIALCVIDRPKKELRYAGAKNPMFIVKNGELEAIKADRMSIGGKTPLKLVGKLFTTHTIPIDTDTWFYIFSDGYPDQFGGDKPSKFMIKRFRENLLANHSLAMPEQREKLQNEFEWWKEGNEQTDDVLVIGGYLKA